MSIKYPKGEIVWVSYYDTNHNLLFIMTSKPMRDYYFLYELIDGGLKKIGRAANPIELEEKFNVYERMSV